jgi:hypothetical protein
MHLPILGKLPIVGVFPLPEIIGNAEFGEMVRDRKN